MELEPMSNEELKELAREPEVLALPEGVLHRVRWAILQATAANALEAALSPARLATSRAAEALARFVATHNLASLRKGPHWDHLIALTNAFLDTFEQPTMPARRDPTADVARVRAWLEKIGPCPLCDAARDAERAAKTGKAILGHGPVPTPGVPIPCMKCGATGHCQCWPVTTGPGPKAEEGANP